MRSLLLCALLLGAPDLAQAAGAADVPPGARSELEVASALRVHVAERLGLPAHDVEVQATGLGRPLQCAPGAEVAVQSGPTEDFRGWTDLRIGGGGCEALRVRAQLVVWREAPVAAEATPAGGRVSVQQRKLRIDELIGAPVDPLGGPYVAIGPLRAGEPLTVGRVKLAPDGRSGATVVIEARAGGLLVEVPGRLMQDGAVGERVRVLNTVHGVVVEGTLVAADRVRTTGGG